MSKVLALGIDALEFDDLMQHLDVLPSFSKLLQTGQRIDLRSSAQTLDASVWPTFSNASLPGEHGTYFPLQWDYRQARFCNISEGTPWHSHTPFWSDAAAAGARIGILDLPMFSDSGSGSGAGQVERFHWHTQESGNVTDLNNSPIWKAIDSEIPLPGLGVDVPADLSESQEQAVYSSVLCSIRDRGCVIKRLLAAERWDCFLGVFSEVHRAGHYFWPDPNSTDCTINAARMRSIYIALDQVLGELLDTATDDYSIILFALHGMAPNSSQAHFVAPLLERFSQLTMGCKPSLRANATRWLRKKVPAVVQRQVGAMVGRKIRDRVVGSELVGGLDWQHTPVFSVPTGGQGFVRFNIAGRELHGVVELDSAEADAIRDSLRNEFHSLRDLESGELLVEKIHEDDSDWTGHSAAFLPDWSIIWRSLPPSSSATTQKLGSFKARLLTGRGGNHTVSAFALAEDCSTFAALPRPKHISELGRFLLGGNIRNPTMTT